MPDVSKMRCECGGEVRVEAWGAGNVCQKCGAVCDDYTALAHGRYWAFKDKVREIYKDAVAAWYDDRTPIGEFDLDAFVKRLQEVLGI